MPATDVLIIGVRYRHITLGIKKASIRVMRGKGGFLARHLLKDSRGVLYSRKPFLLYGILLLVILIYIYIIRWAAGSWEGKGSTLAVTVL